MSETYDHNSHTVLKYFQEDHGVEWALYDMRNRDALVMMKRSFVMGE
jgi:hypothetical protein